MIPSKLYTSSDKLLQVGVFLAFWGAYLSVSLIGAGVLLSLIAMFFLLFYPSVRENVRHHPLFYPVLFLALSISLSIALAEPYPFQKPLEKVGYLLALFPFSYSFQRHPEQRQIVLKSCLLFSFLLFWVALGQFGGFFQGWDSFLTRHSKPLGTSFRPFFLATGLTFHHTPFAATMTWAFHILLAHSFFSRTKTHRFFLGVGAILCFFSILFSFSRGVWLALIFSMGISFGLFNWKKLFPLVVLGGLVFFLLFSLSPDFQNRILSIQLSQNSERLELWKIALRMFQDAPLLGQGYHSFSHRLGAFTDPGKLDPSFPREAHNMYLDFLATTGLVGFLSFISYLILTLKNLWLAWFQLNLSESERPWILASISGFIAFLIAGFFDRHFYMSQTLVPQLGVLAIAFAIISGRK